MPTRTKTVARGTSKPAATTKLQAIKLTGNTLSQLPTFLKALDKRYKLENKLVMNIDSTWQGSAITWNIGIALNGKPQAAFSGPNPVVVATKVLNDAQIFLHNQYMAAETTEARRTA